MGKIKIVHLLKLSLALCIVFSGGCKKETAWKPGAPLPKEKIQIAVIHLNDINRNSFFDNAHYLGLIDMQQNIGLGSNQIIRKVNVYDGDLGFVEGVMRDCIADGANIIIATNNGYMDVCEKMAEEFPSVIFAQAMGFKSNNQNLTYCTTKLYQARYLSGIVAGLNTKTNRIGYVAAFGKDNSEVTAGVNAFAIGVEEVNPAARIYVLVTHNWYDPMGETDAANALIASGCDVIATHCNTPNAQVAAGKAGAKTIGYNTDMSSNAPDAVLTSVVPIWGVIYTRFVESIINGTFMAAQPFYGLAEGAVDITTINEKIASPFTHVAVETSRQRIVQKGFSIFEGVLRTNDGRIVDDTGKALSDNTILDNTNWYYRNVSSLEAAQGN